MIFAVVLLAFATANLSAQDIRYVTIYYDPPPGDSLILPEFLPCDGGDTLFIINGCGFAIDVEFNGNAGTQTVNLAHEDTTFYECTDDYDCYEAWATSGKGRATYLCESPFGAEVPTLSEWGMIIFSLLILSLVTVVVTRRRTATAADGAGGSITISGPIFVPARFMKALTVTLGLAVAILVTAMALSGSIPLRDIIGTILSAAIVAYIVHLWIVPKEEE